MKEAKKTKNQQVSIAGMPFKIKYFKKLPFRLKEELGEDTIGYCDWGNQEIGIVIHKSKFMNELSLFHEIGHAVADSIKGNNGLANESFAKPFFQLFFGALVDAGFIQLKKQ